MFADDDDEVVAVVVAHVASSYATRRRWHLPDRVLRLGSVKCKTKRLCKIVNFPPNIVARDRVQRKRLAHNEYSQL